MIFLLTFYGHELIINEIFMNYLMGHSWKFVFFYSLAIKDTNDHELNHK